MNSRGRTPRPRWQPNELTSHRAARVINGVHFASWMSSHVLEALSAELGPDWVDRADRPGFWYSVLRVDDVVLWQAHRALKTTLLRAVRDESRARWVSRGTAARNLAAGGMLLDPETLTIGFVRRFTSYNHTPLLFRDLDALEHLVSDWRLPAQVIFAGQPHPADDVLQQARFGGRIAFVPDSERHLMRHLIQGVDLWLNVPRSHGSNDLSAALNAVPELSTSDGWWAEGYGELNGWETRDEREIGGLYRLLEERVKPLFYTRDARDVPLGWVAKMKHALRLADPRLTAQRMAREYVTRRHAPSGRALSGAGDVMPAMADAVP